MKTILFLIIAAIVPLALSKKEPPPLPKPDWMKPNSPYGKPNSPSPDGKPKPPSPNWKPKPPLTNGKPNPPTPDGKPKPPKPNQEADIIDDMLQKHNDYRAAPHTMPTACPLIPM